MSAYLRTRNGHYYLRLRIPSDLLGISTSSEILKALHTKDRKEALLAASVLRPQLLKIFSLTRCGFITDEQASKQIEGILQMKARRRTSVVPETSTPQSPLLRQVIEQYTNDHKPEWTEKTQLEYGGYMRLIQDVLQVQTVADVNRDEVRRLRDTLCRLPANLYKKHPGKTISAILELENVVPMSITTVNKLLTLFGGVMRHCVKEGYRIDNPVEGLKINQNRRRDEERKAYAKDDLRRIVAALPSPAVTPDKYWIPMIGMYSGMRLGEICGLHLEDIKLVDGVWCFDVNDEGDKRLKNLSSRRIIPIHPWLLNRGLLNFVATLREKGENRLWPNLVKREIDGYCHSFGNWFGRFNRKYVTMDPLKSFHSLRHTFADSLKQRGVHEVMISELMGHANNNISTGRYGKRYEPVALLASVSKLDFDLSVILS